MPKYVIQDDALRRDLEAGAARGETREHLFQRLRDEGVTTMSHATLKRRCVDWGISFKQRRWPQTSGRSTVVLSVPVEIYIDEQGRLQARVVR